MAIKFKGSTDPEDSRDILYSDSYPHKSLWQPSASEDIYGSYLFPDGTGNTYFDHVRRPEFIKQDYWGDTLSGEDYIIVGAEGPYSTLFGYTVYHELDFYHLAYGRVYYCFEGDYGGFPENQAGKLYVTDMDAPSHNVDGQGTPLDRAYIQATRRLDTKYWDPVNQTGHITDERRVGNTTLDIGSFVDDRWGKPMFLGNNRIHVGAIGYAIQDRKDSKSKGAYFVYTKDADPDLELSSLCFNDVSDIRLGTNTVLSGDADNMFMWALSGYDKTQGTQRAIVRDDKIMVNVEEHTLFLDDRQWNGDRYTSYQTCIFGDGRAYWFGAAGKEWGILDQVWDFGLSTDIAKLIITDTYAGFSTNLYIFGIDAEADLYAYAMNCGCNRLCVTANGAGSFSGYPTPGAIYLHTREGDYIRTLSWSDDGSTGYHISAESNLGYGTLTSTGDRGRFFIEIKNNLIFVLDPAWELGLSTPSKGRFYIYTLDGELLLALSPHDIGYHEVMQFNMFSTDGVNIDLVTQQYSHLSVSIRLKVAQTLSDYYDKQIENYRY